jgi:hypothetical protein
VAGDENSHLCFLEKNFPSVDASFEDHQDLEWEAYSNVDTGGSGPFPGAGLMMSKEMKIPLMPFQVHSESLSLFVWDLAEAADRLGKNCIPSST